jgi:hypothetical protein
LSSEQSLKAAFRLLPIADEYQIQKLKDKCEDVLKSNIESDSFTQDFLIQCLVVADKYYLQRLLNICVEKCANSKRLWKLAKENGNISLEMLAKVYESRLVLYVVWVYVVGVVEVSVPFDIDSGFHEVAQFLLDEILQQ